VRISYVRGILGATSAFEFLETQNSLQDLRPFSIRQPPRNEIQEVDGFSKFRGGKVYASSVDHESRVSAQTQMTYGAH